MPDGTKPLPEPMLTNHQWGLVASRWGDYLTRNTQDIYPSHELEMTNLRFQPYLPGANELTHWGRVTHICVNKLTIIDSDNGLSPSRRQAIIWTYDDSWPISSYKEQYSVNFNPKSNIFIQENAFESVVWKMAAILSRPQCVNLRQLSSSLQRTTSGRLSSQASTIFRTAAQIESSLSPSKQASITHPSTIPWTPSSPTIARHSLSDSASLIWPQSCLAGTSMSSGHGGVGGVSSSHLGQRNTRYVGILSALLVLLREAPNHRWSAQFTKD